MATMLMPDYGGRCLSSLLPVLRRRAGAPTEALGDLNAATDGASGIVLVILDGLGDEQLAARAALAPTLAAGRLDPITSVGPSTTAAALTSITTGLAPGAHGVLGYRFLHHGDVLQALRWTIDGRDATRDHPPEVVAPRAPDLRDGSAGVPYVGKEAFEKSSFTRAHLRGAAYEGIADAEGLPAAVAAASERHPLVLAYHDAIDKVAHLEGLGEAYDASLAEADRMVMRLRAALPDDVALVVVSDHGQVDVGPTAVDLSASTDALVARRSGEGRFRWLHAQHGASAELAERAAQELEATCWTLSRRQVLAAEILGEVDDDFVDRLGDVAVIPHADVFVPDPAEPREHKMRSRHGSLTSAEMLVPLCVI